jgi:WD40 repeat protein
MSIFIDYKLLILDHSFSHVDLFFFQVKTRLNGHQKRITGLAFSNNLHVLVSSGADAQVTIWNTFLSSFLFFCL